MKLDTVIFDLDGLLVDSEPLWKEAADELLSAYGRSLTRDEYRVTTGLRTREFLEHWFDHFKLDMARLPEAEEQIVSTLIALLKQKARPMAGVEHIMRFFRERAFKIGLASSSPPSVIQTAVEIVGIQDYLQAVSSAQTLPYGKPHPEVYLNCAAELGSVAARCICFEDSFNGMIAAKAAKMKCVIVPSMQDAKNPVWEAADLKLSTLLNFNELLLARLQST